MKSKRIFSLAIIALAALCLFLMPKANYSAAAQAVTIEKAQGHKYDREYLLEEAGLTKLENQSTLAGGREVKFKLSTDADFAVADSSVEFKAIGTYNFEVYKTGEATAELAFDVTVVKNDDITVESLSYDVSNEKITEYNGRLATAVKDLKVGDDFVVPTLEGLAKSKFFEYGDLTSTIYYAEPQSSSYTSTSNKFELSKTGVYSYYVLFTDCANNKMSVEDLVIGNGGWYKKDADGNATGELIVPIFSFTVDKTSKPKISTLTAEEGFLNLEYSIECFTITSSSYKTQYTLYYSDKDAVNKDDYKSDAEYIQAVKAASVVTEDMLDQDKLTFTPDKKGNYYVLVRVVDESNESDEAMSRVIKVEKEFTEVKKEVAQTFINNNLVSVIFLSISIVSFIALIVVICIKPKEKNVTLEVKSSKK